ncbi:MAG: hypothetical protein KBC32_07835 [Candidatus Didemnitutus sp.]|nr:hypothetical protein [Candidatus Didemnitutus sp.]
MPSPIPNAAANFAAFRSALFRLVASVAIFCFVLISSAPAQVAYSTPASELTFDFNQGLPAAAATPAWSDNSTFPGWYAYRQNGGTPSEYRRTNGWSDNQHLFHWRSSATSGNGTLGVFPKIAWGSMHMVLRLRNNSGVTLTSFTLAYTGKQWWTSNSGQPGVLNVTYRLSEPSGMNFANNSGFTSIPSLAFTSPVTGDSSQTRADLDGNSSANRTVLEAVTITGVNWAPDTDLWIRWSYINNSSVLDHGLGIDDVKFSADGPILLDGSLSLHGSLRLISDGSNYTTATPRTDGGLNVVTTGTGHLTLNPGGNVGIGTAAPSHKLSVNGAIRAKEVIVDTGWADYVFEEGYRLVPLSEVEAHIKARKHLPGIPSAAEIAAGGLGMGEMQALMMAKIEELTLHQIEQEKRLSEQAVRISQLERENAALRQP